MRVRKLITFIKSNWLILLIVLLGAVIRGLYAFVPLTKLSPDEATYGLGALHWLKGIDYPIFYYAQPYTGTLSAIISAGLMRLFGVYPLWLKVVPLLCSIAFIYTNYLLGKSMFAVCEAGAHTPSGRGRDRGETIGIVAALLTAFASPFFLNWSSRAGSGYPEMILLGNIILLLVLKIVYGNDRRSAESPVVESPSRAVYFFLGFLGGLGFWVQPTIIYYALPALFVLWLWKPWLLFTLSGWLLVLGVALGSAPVIYYNVVNNAATTSALFHDPWGVKQAASTFWTVGFPIVAGLRASWSTTDFFLPLSILIYLLYLVAGIWLLSGLAFRLFWEETFGFVIAWGKRLLRFLRGSPSEFRVSLWSQEVARLVRPGWLIWGVLLTTWVVFSLSGQFGQFVIEPRYILSLYTVLPLLLANFLVKVPVPHRVVRYVLVGLVVFSQVVGVFIGGKNTRPSTFLEQYSLKDLVAFLEEHNLAYVYSDEDICHRLIFETNERIICTPITEGFTTNRYPAYRGMVFNAPREQLAYVRVPGKTFNTQECLEDLSKQEHPCKFKDVGGFGVYWYR